MTLQELVQKAQEAEGLGIPVDWRAMTLGVLRDASAGVAELEEQLVEKSRWVSDARAVFNLETGRDLHSCTEKYREGQERVIKKEAEAPVDTE